MYIGTLVEDTIEKEFLSNDHGLSLYIKYNNKNILFDAGPSDILIENSLKMNLDLSEIDYLVISHGHFDHGGGIIPFLEKNKKAKVYIQKYCNKEFYFDNGKDSEKEYIGLNPEIFDKYSDRIVYTENKTVSINENIFLVPNVKVTEKITKNNEAMLINDSKDFKRDDFEHEQAMVIKDENKCYLFSGCSHKGIINIVQSIKEEFNIDKIDFLIGGLHLVEDPILRTSIESEDLDKVANCLQENVNTTFTCHCTGDSAYNYLKRTLQNKINYLRTGSEVNI